MAGKRLTYLDSSYSSGSPYYDTSGNTYGSYSSYSSRQTMDLCSDGSFNTASSSSSSFDYAGGMGNTCGSDSGAGRWAVVTSADGESLLQLTYPDGNIGEYRLEYRDMKIYLNGTRYYRVTSEVCQ